MKLQASCPGLSFLRKSSNAARQVAVVIAERSVGSTNNKSCTHNHFDAVILQLDDSLSAVYVQFGRPVLGNWDHIDPRVMS